MLSGERNRAYKKVGIAFIADDKSNSAESFCSTLFRSWRYGSVCVADQSLNIDRQVGHSFDSFSGFDESVFDHEIIESGDDHIVPMVADTAEGDVEHGDDIFTERIFGFEGDRTEKFLAFGISGVVGAGIGFEVFEVDFLADPGAHFVGMCGEIIDQ